MPRADGGLRGAGASTTPKGPPPATVRAGTGVTSIRTRPTATARSRSRTGSAAPSSGARTSWPSRITTRSATTASRIAGRTRSPRSGRSEVTTFNGHLNCFGLGDAIDWYDATRGGGPAGIVEQAHRQGALISINHPSAFGNPWCNGCHWDYALVDYATIDAIEVWNGRWRMPESDNNGALAFWTDLLDAGFRPTAVSGTDSHSAEEDEYIALPMNHVYADDRSEASILDGIRRGRVFLSSGPTLSFRARGSDGAEVTLPGEHLPADGTFDLTVDVERLEAPATLWYVTSGSAVPLGECGPGQRACRARGAGRDESGGASSCARARRPTGTSSR